MILWHVCLFFGDTRWIISILFAKFSWRTNGVLNVFDTFDDFGFLILFPWLHLCDWFPWLPFYDWQWAKNSQNTMIIIIVINVFVNFDLHCDLSFWSWYLMWQGESVATKLRKVAKVSDNFARCATHLVKFRKFEEVAPKMYNNRNYVTLLY